MMSIRRNVVWVASVRRRAPTGRQRLSRYVGFAELGSDCSSTATRFERESRLGEFQARLDGGAVPACLWDLVEPSDNAGGLR